MDGMLQMAQVEHSEEDLLTIYSKVTLKVARHMENLNMAGYRGAEELKDPRDGRPLRITE